MHPALVVRDSGGRPLGSLVLYRGPGERSFVREDELLLEQAARYVARGLEVPSAGLVAGEFVERRRAGSGKFVLIIGILATTAVVIYSVKLFMGFQGGPGPR